MKCQVYIFLINYTYVPKDVEPFKNRVTLPIQVLIQLRK
jgi:hypothetical protein